MSSRDISPRSLVYRFYAARLEREVRSVPMPTHIGVILDGNRRFAKERGLSSPAMGHRLGAEKIPELLDWCYDLGIEWVTLWLLSTDNFNREQSELDSLVGIINDTVTSLADQQTERWPGLVLTALGALDIVPGPLQQTLQEVHEQTKASATQWHNASHGDAKTLHVQVAIGYGGREEIAEALKSLLREKRDEGQSIDEIISSLSPDEISKFVNVAGTPDPDLIIRTSGEIRLSGFLLWQSVHSEFYFCDPYWPEFRFIDFLRALRSYQQRARRFGK